MTHVYIFNLSLLVACLYAFWGGGSPERAIALIFLCATSVTLAIPYKHFHALEGLVLLVDVITFAALTTVALRANRFWPLYESALQLLTIAVHGVKAYNPDFAYWMYNGATGKLAYPTVVLLAIGVFRHRARIAQFGSDRDWSAWRRGAGGPDPIG